MTPVKPALTACVLEPRMRNKLEIFDHVSDVSVTL